ncbi:hypothetical protein FOXG_07643 [Fusarium oxysporum f. sp. lycopersici 4287]|uniref:Methyltransferase domain-containing protein n=3 Tax=Fusarium oxysporum TaxID=5507 RepID=A0A0J9V3A3_FUSO4|nr:hypothetical protein FOXG_07643 [Fusarium oxysporum f. sp. lycopersici 4287]EXK45927.1 hypothetical protein FOMG_04175 [Fusarium oxysporum f. sp. melonis 26406]KAJ9426299.1 S-adenosyl-L-methionine-dependent methyltransferase [Fusarium oxysporum]KNB05326.1 hypothetical protein FOXG_07643 [Fusarium oxysporum f. sp. lycopersici 4287]
MNIYTIHLRNPTVKPLIRMEHEPVEDIPHCHHHHHHLQYHTHHHHHGPSHEIPRSMGEQNKAHYNNAPPALFRWPWIIELCNQISKELRSNIDWIGIRPPSSRPTKLLDYACGDGVASRALAPFMSTVRGMDIASGMVEQYNKMALKAGYTSTKMRAVQGDLIDPELTPSPETNTPGFFDFDVVAMCMALHHIEDPENMISQLSKRLRPGGILLIIDWVASSAGSSAQTGNRTLGAISRMGFQENEVKSSFDKAGLEDWAWKLTSAPSQVPREIGGEQQLFLARGKKPFS